MEEHIQTLRAAQKAAQKRAVRMDITSRKAREKGYAGERCRGLRSRWWNKFRHAQAARLLAEAALKFAAASKKYSSAKYSSESEGENLLLKAILVLKVSLTGRKLFAERILNAPSDPTTAGMEGPPNHRMRIVVRRAG